MLLPFVASGPIVMSCTSLTVSFSTFNSSDNKEGKNIKIILTNISEGLDLKRIRLHFSLKL